MSGSRTEVWGMLTSDTPLRIVLSRISEFPFFRGLPLTPITFASKGEFNALFKMTGMNGFMGQMILFYGVWIGVMPAFSSSK